MPQRFQYKVFPLDEAVNLFEVNYSDSRPGYLHEAIKAALENGFRWARTDGEHAVFERVVEFETPEPVEMLSALRAAAGIVRQHNLFTASEQDRTDTLNRFFTWWNYVALPALYPGDFVKSEDPSPSVRELVTYAQDKHEQRKDWKDRR